MARYMLADSKRAGGRDFVVQRIAEMCSLLSLVVMDANGLQRFKMLFNKINGM